MIHKAASLWISGTPVQQGSKKHVGKGIMVEAAKGLKAWRRDVALVASECQQTVGTLDGFLILECDFFFKMPVSRPKLVREAGIWPKRTMPDGDKLLRSIGDSLTTSGLISDDARIFRYVGTKWETTGDIGACVSLYQWDESSLDSLKIDPLGT